MSWCWFFSVSFVPFFVLLSCCYYLKQRTHCSVSFCLHCSYFFTYKFLTLPHSSSLMSFSPFINGKFAFICGLCLLLFAYENEYVKPTKKPKKLQTCNIFVVAGIVFVHILLSILSYAYTYNARYSLIQGVNKK